MEQTKHPAPVMGREVLSKLGGTDNINIPKKPKAINREKILEEIAVKWSVMGLYQSPTRAMIALLGVSDAY